MNTDAQTIIYFDALDEPITSFLHGARVVAEGMEEPARTFVLNYVNHCTQQILECCYNNRSWESLATELEWDSTSTGQKSNIGLAKALLQMLTETLQVSPR